MGRGLSSRETLRRAFGRLGRFVMKPYWVNEAEKYAPPKIANYQ